MRKYFEHLAAALLAGTASVSAGRVGTAATEPGDIAGKIRKIVHEHFFDPGRLAAFDTLIATTKGTASREGIDEALAALGASHTGYYTPDQIDYYELADLYHFAIAPENWRLLAPDGMVSYQGIGMIAARQDGAVFVTDVYDAGPAALAGVRVGDEVTAVDGKPYREIASFKGKAGQSVSLKLRREKGAVPVELVVGVVDIQPRTAFTTAVSASIRTIAFRGAGIGYIRLWSFTSDETLELIKKELGSGRLKHANALVLDLRGRWGSAPPDAAEIFVGGTPSSEMVMRNGKAIVANVRWNKPVVALIDEGTRSGLEVFAYALKKKGIPLIGKNTAGAVLGGTAFLLPDDSLLSLAVAAMRVDGTVLEGTGVAPDIKVERRIPYAGGADPQLAVALATVREKV